MTVEEAKKELKTYHSNILQMNNAINRLRELEERVVSIRSQDYEKTFVDGGVRTSTVERAYEQIEKVSRQCAETVKECRENTQAVLNTIKEIGGTLSEILMKRYIFRQSFERVAVDLHYDYRSIMRLHKRSLQEYSSAKSFLAKNGSCHKMS